MSPLSLALLLSLWLHILAAVLWIGGIIYNAVVFTLPATALGPAERARLLRRVAPLVWASLIVLLPTGVWNTIFNPAIP